MNDFGFHDAGFRRLLGYLAQVPAVRTKRKPRARLRRPPKQ